jgi:Methyltransferase domain
MIGKLRAWLARRREGRRLWRKRKKKYARWLAAHPGGSYTQFYVEEVRRQIDAGMMRHSNLGLDVNTGAMKRSAQRILEAFKRAGCRPHHVVVDYGCGSLWIGEAFMDYLEPGNYVGLDVSDTFYTEGLTRFPETYVAERRPMLRVISDESLREVRDRKPDFILSTGVLMHVAPEDLASYFASLTAAAVPDTRIEIGHRVRRVSGWEPPRFWRHSRFTISSTLSGTGYKAEYAARHRIVPTMPGFALVRR